MKEKIDFSEAPYQYAMCLNEQCQKATTCLRQIIEQNVPDKIEHWVIISPKHLSALKGECPYYRSNQKIRYAKGFIGMLDAIPHKQMQSAISDLMGYFGRRTYYRSRKGERLLSPSEQQDVLRILKNSGVTSPLDFDLYIEDYNW